MHLKLTVSLFTLFLAGTAAAEPITGRYNVLVTLRTSYSNNQVEAVNAAFPLTLTFDDRVTFEQSDPSWGFLDRYYGMVPPLFSDIPLPVVSSPAGEDIGRAPFTIPPNQSRGIADTGDWVHWAEAGLLLENPVSSPYAYSSSVWMQVFQTGLTEPPALTPRSLIERLGRPTNDFNFTYEVLLQSRASGEYSSDSYRYMGFATLADAPLPDAPVPEPASMILLSLGLGAGIVQVIRAKSLER